MTTEQILNLQYRKILTSKQTIRDLIEQSLIFKINTIELCEIEILGLLLIELDNNDKEELSDDEANIIKPLLKSLIDDNNNQKKEYDIKTIEIIKKIGETKKINLELNKLIALKYAEYINTIDPLMSIGINVIENIY